MQEGKLDRQWSVTLTPHRSLTRQGFVALMAILVLFNFAGGLLFFVAGAWPVTGFMGLDVILVWWALRQNFADARCAERITIRNDIVLLQRLSPTGLRESLEFNRRWLKVELEFDKARDMVGRLLFVYRGQTTEIGAFLGGDERQSLSQEIRTALA